jgi:hypothetical protein
MGMRGTKPRAASIEGVSEVNYVYENGIAIGYMAGETFVRFINPVRLP